MVKDSTDGESSETYNFVDGHAELKFYIVYRNVLATHADLMHAPVSYIAFKVNEYTMSLTGMY